MLAKIRIPQCGDIETQFIPVSFTGPDEEFSYRKDDYVAALMDDGLDDGWIICRLPDPSLETGDITGKVFKKKFRDGAVISYDENTGTYKIDLGQNVFEMKPGEISLKNKTIGAITIKPGSLELEGLPGAVFNVAHSGSIDSVTGTGMVNCSTSVKVSV